MAQCNASHILVGSQTEAQEIIERVRSGENFEALARKHSKCPSGKDGGSLGWFGRGQMVAPFEKACFAGKEGDVVGPVKTQFGWHVIRINGKK
ncbi:peptidylprolyl isomerase [Methanofollis fontis]|uniref:Peptidyl-prolyl cis-trans isomerase C n=1 Tax=Methanofollis fontis TaxID=2052832 RepID=A0A483CRL8_9EURY|nr:peptidylprolyl isomerase [Methanofollis fontis]TAJ45765.1 peptidylprolyl isomerase [Methanofollis fontis]